jgi:hypothetical protein
MSLDFVTPFDPLPSHAPPGRRASHGPLWRRIAADLCFILVEAGGFLSSTYLMTLGVPLLVLLLASGGNLDRLFLQLGNLSNHFGAAPPPARSEFAHLVVLGLIAIASLIGVLRLPRFLNDVSDELARERNIP